MSDYVRQLKLIAMSNVVDQPSEYAIRQIFRWYSERFHTPLHLVEDLQFEDVLQTYFECQFEEMDEGTRHATIQKLTISPEQLAHARKSEDAEDADQWEFAREAEQQEKEKEATQPPQQNKLPKADLPAPAALVPTNEEIHINFEDLDGDCDALGPPA